jgi:hypothetical protein
MKIARLPSSEGTPYQGCATLRAIPAVKHKAHSTDLKYQWMTFGPIRVQKKLRCGREHRLLEFTSPAFLVDDDRDNSKQPTLRWPFTRWSGLSLACTSL